MSAFMDTNTGKSLKYIGWANKEVQFRGLDIQQ